jgi:uncharacterized protein YrrD
MNSQHVKGLTVISIADGQRLGSVTEVYLDPDGRSVTAFAIGHGSSLLSTGDDSARLLDAGDVRAIGPDALMVADAGVLEVPTGGVQRFRLDDLLKRKVVSESGEYVGQVAAVEFDDRGMQVTGIEVSPGFFKSNRVLQATHVINIGEELVIVSDAVCAPQAPEPEAAEQSSWVVGDVDTGDRDSGSRA